jgi:hypothetical protein
MIAVWKAGAVEGGFVLAMVSALLTLIIAVAGVLALVGEPHNGHEAGGGREPDARPPSPPAAPARPEQSVSASAPSRAAASKFHVQTQGGPAYIAETISFTSGPRAGSGPGDASEGGAFHVG